MGIGVAAVGRLLKPQPLENVGLELAVSLVAAGVNGGVGLVLLRGGRLGSAALRADGHHLLTGEWASAGVVAGVFLMWLTGWLILDPLIAFVVAENIVWVGAPLLDDTSHGLLDSALPPPNKRSSPTYSRDTKVRASGSTPLGPGPPARRFVSMHVLVPGE